MGIPKSRYFFVALLLLAGLAAFQNCGQGSSYDSDSSTGTSSEGDIQLSPDLPSNGSTVASAFKSESTCSAVDAASYIKSISFGTYRSIDSVLITSRDNVSRVYGWNSTTNTQTLNVLFNELVTLISVQLTGTTAKVNLKKSTTLQTESFTCP